ncbi:MAG: carbohydrate ABC transporter permease [Lachnospiraceae bacterium]|nr:carbohydrate ABC transporter permease [Lachnospiraceae bacterium]
MVESHSDRTFKVLSHVIMVILSLVAVIPILLLVICSFTDNSTLLTNGYSFFPAKLSLENYAYILENSSKIFRAYGVSIVLTATGTVLGTAITILLGYGLSKKDLPGNKAISFILILTLLFNGGLVPTYMVYTNTLHVKNTFWGLLLPSLLMNGFNVILVKSYFVTSVPDEILEAAEIDGATEYQKFIRIAFPMAVPIVATIALFTGIGYWNDWNNGYIYISTKTDLYSIQNLLNRMQENLQFLTSNSTGVASYSNGITEIPSEGVRMAIAVLGMLPIMVVYPWLQRFFIQGITLGGVKG